MISAARQRFNSWLLEYQLLAAVALYNIVDFLTTKILIDRRQSLDTEDNPMLLTSMEYYDTAWMIIIIKALFLFVAWALMYRYFDPMKHKTVKYVLFLVLLPFIGISIVNYYLVFTFKL